LALASVAVVEEVSMSRTPDQITPRRFQVSERMQGALVVATSAAIMIGLAVAAMTMLTSPDGWVMKAANQAMFDQQQAIATSYALNTGD
jgi:hypothetical protein